MDSPISVKVCGITDADAGRAAVDAGADYLGLVFARSPRRLTPNAAERLVEAVPAAWVGVFVDPDPDQLRQTAERLGLHAVQLHGSESPELCRAIRLACHRPVWKALRWDTGARTVEAYAASCDALLLDGTDGDRLGGTGRTLPWDRLAVRLAARPRRTPVFLAGGLGPENVDEAVRAVDPDGVDASSRLERTPGRKDPDLVRRFVAAARATSNAGSGR